MAEKHASSQAKKISKETRTTLPDACTVCGNRMTTRFCAHCGQEATGRRMTYSAVFGDLFNNMLSLERSFLANLWLALKDPYILVNNYWNGYRRYYMGPGKFLAIASLMVGVNFMITDGYFLGIRFSSTSLSVNFVFLIVLLAFSPLISMFSYFKFRRNANEHLVMNMYTISLWTMLFTPLSIALDTFDIPSTKQGIAALYLFMIHLWNARCFPLRNLWWRVLMAGLGFGLFILILWVLATR